MIHLSLLFWLALAIPGYAVLCRFDRGQLKSGLLGVLGLSYLATLGLLSPISILCHLLRLPVAVFAGACVLLVVAGVIEISRRRWWRDAGMLLVGAVGVELLIVVLDLVLGARTGAFMDGDARVHLARIRQLLDHGFSNDDPFVAGGHFFSIYHTNLLHGLYAACAWVTRIDYLSVWYASLPFAKLLVASGCYYLAWCIFGRYWPAWVAALFFLIARAPTNFLIYPNKICPWWLMPILVGLAVHACRPGCGWKDVIKLGVGTLVVGQIHGLYGGFALMLVGPLTAGFAVAKFIRRRADRWPQLACALVLAVALPFPLISKATSAKSSAGPEQAEQVTSAEEDEFLELGGGLRMKDPSGGFGEGGGWRYYLLAGGAIAALCTRRRAEAARVLAVVLVAAAIFFVPPICSAGLAVVGQKWILSRLEFIFPISFAVLVPATIAFLIEGRTRFWWVRALLSVGACLAALAYAGQHGPFTWPDYVKAAMRPASERYKRLNKLRVLEAFFRAHIPSGETVLAEPDVGMGLVMFCDCHILAPTHGSMGVPGLSKLRDDNKQMVAEDTSWEARRQLLKTYGIRYFVFIRRAEWWRAHVERYCECKGVRATVVELKLD